MWCSASESSSVNLSGSSRRTLLFSPRGVIYGSSHILRQIVSVPLHLSCLMRAASCNCPQCSPSLIRSNARVASSMNMVTSSSEVTLARCLIGLVSVSISIHVSMHRLYSAHPASVATSRATCSSGLCSTHWSHFQSAPARCGANVSGQGGPICLPRTVLTLSNACWYTSCTAATIGRAFSSSFSTVPVPDPHPTAVNAAAIVSALRAGAKTTSVFRYMGSMV